MNNGDIVFIKEATRAPDKKETRVQFIGHGMCLLLGHLPPKIPMPPMDYYRILLGGIGFLSFDEVAEFLGKEAMDTCLNAFQKKYFSNAVQTPPAAPPVSKEPA